MKPLLSVNNVTVRFGGLTAMAWLLTFLVHQAGTLLGWGG